jgi:hypothetical protein
MLEMICITTTVVVKIGRVNLSREGQGESAGTLVLTIKTQLLEIVYFWKIDTKFDF